MIQKKKMLTFVCTFVLLILLSSQTAFAGSTTLKYGMRGDSVTKLQQDLKTIGVVSFKATGYYGTLTKKGVIKFQKKYGLKVDGIAGSQTLGKIAKLRGIKSTTVAAAAVKSATSRGDIAPRGSIERLPWFTSVNSLFGIGDIVTVTDVNTGLKLQVKRTYGHNHADVETLTAADTQILKRIAGGDWNWTRRAVIVEVHGHRIAASIAPRPHAGRDDKPANVTVSNRSGDYGTGENLDTVKGNGMDGHFDMHFYGSRTHGTNRVDEAHQKMVQKAYISGL